MATGLGMTSDEWNALRKDVDDSFWVMRAIGFECLGLTSFWIAANDCLFFYSDTRIPSLTQ